MLIGIDVGGTFTDGVVLDKGRIISFAKEATDEQELSATLLKVLDRLLSDLNSDAIARIVLSTTLVTNLIVTDRGPRTALLLMPGFGLPQAAYDLAPDTYFLKGCIDFRGNEVAPPDTREIQAVINKIKEQGIKNVAIAGKFSNRSQQHESLVKTLLEENYPEASVVTSFQIAQQLNFPRRAYTAYLTARTRARWNQFIDDMQEAMKERHINAPVHILKADGGTMMLETAREHPCETILSGPAASTVGGLALTINDQLNSVVLDVGGTTTDISLIIEGKPLHASQGAKINEKLTHIRSLAVKSIALGGDSVVCNNAGLLKIGPEREGAAACFGGQQATITDAFNYLYELQIGDLSLSAEKMNRISAELDIPVMDLCREVVDKTMGRLQETITGMFKEWEQEPAYRVWEIVNRRAFRLDRIIGIGAAAAVIVPRLAEELNIDYLVHQYSPVANALGSSAARPTLAVNMHADTQADLFTIDPGGIQGNLGKVRNLQLEDIKEITRRYLQDIAAERGLGEYADEAQFTREEQFNVLSGWDRMGKLFDVGMQIDPGLINEFKGVDEI